MSACVADSTCLISLDRIGQLELLRRVFPETVIPSAVQAEFGRMPERIHLQKPRNDELVRALREHLGAGESEVIALGIELSSLVVLDNRRARRTARTLGLSVIGTLGLLVRAKRLGHVERVKPLIDALTDSGFYMNTELSSHILERVGE